MSRRENRYGTPLTFGRLSWSERRAPPQPPRSKWDRLVEAPIRRREREQQARRNAHRQSSYMVTEAVEHGESPRLIRAAEITTSAPAPAPTTQPRQTFAEMRADLEQSNPQIVRQAANARARLRAKATK